MHCPKCKHEQRDKNECEACGLIFSRYRVVQERKKETEAQKALVAGRKPGFAMRFLQTVILVTVVASTTYYFTSADKENDPGRSVTESATSKRNITAPQKTVSGNNNEKTGAAPLIANSGRNGIELARKATVSIETPWGTGSGFFVNQYYIVTNRHVVELDQDKIDEFREKVETTRRLIDLEEDKIRDMKEDLQRLPGGPTRSQLALIIEARRKELDRILPEQAEREEKLRQLETDMEPSDIKVFLADDSEHSANYVLVSDKYDLALMALFSGEYPFLPRPPAGTKLYQGQKVYTVGSPVGLRHTVTAGVFSGYRKRDTDGQRFLQTDAAINPGNSGGPLIDEHGFVHGVNTMILRDTEGIGFAIPIEKVFEEFDSTLY